MKWIKCSDELPESHRNVLIFVDTHHWGGPYIAMGQREKYYKEDNDKAWRWAWNNLYDGDENGNYIGTWGNITHWMPLPSYPEKEQSELD